jgi:hypothetical protein
MSDAAFASSSQSKMARAKSGVWEEENNFAGMTVAEVRASRTKTWRIPADSVAYKGKAVVDESYIIEPGDKIEFVKGQGVKG